MTSSKREPKLIIRALSPKDIPRMVETWETAGLSYRPSGRDSPASLRRQIALSPDLFLGAFISKDLVGVVLGSDDGRRGWINRLAVIPGARGIGVAKALVAACEAALRKRGRRLFCATIECENVPSMQLFEGVGYTKESDIIYFAKREDRTY